MGSVTSPNRQIRDPPSRICRFQERHFMKTATSIPPAQAEKAMRLADELQSQASEQSALAGTLAAELELTGELPKDFVGRMEELMAKQQKTLAALIELSTGSEWTR
jgi:hypothetical protein